MKRGHHMIRRHMTGLGRFGTDDRGSVLVEFSIVLPLMLLFFAVTVESARMMWSYQAAISGVRDAGRYLARITPADICITSGSVAGTTGTLKTIVEKDLSGNTLYPAKVTVNSVTPSYSCVTGSFRVSPAAVGTVSASVTMEFTLSGVMSLFGGNLSTVTTTIADSSRIFGQ